MNQLRKLFVPSAAILLLTAVLSALPGNASNDPDPGDILLDVPFVADAGNTWATSCMAMLVSYYRKEVSLKDIVDKAGYPPILKYSAVDEMLLRRFTLRLKQHSDGTLAAIMTSIDGKNPVMVLLHDPARGASCFNTLVVGYNRGTRVFLLRDPSREGAVYRTSFEAFDTQWSRLTRGCRGWPNRPFFTVDAARYTGDVVLAVPFEENRGNTCASSSMAMMLRWLGAPVRFEDVLKRAGMPPIINYEAVTRWIGKDYRIVMMRHDSKTVDDIIRCIKSGNPVMVLQQFTLPRAEGHNRVVVGFNTARGELILNDPSELGFEYRMPVADFERLWDLLPKSCPGWPPRPLWIMIPEGKASPL